MDAEPALLLGLIPFHFAMKQAGPLGSGAGFVSAFMLTSCAKCQTESH